MPKRASNQAAPKTDPQAETQPEKSRDDLLRESYSIATARLREANLEEFYRLRVAAAQELGVEYTPPESKEAKARRQLQELLADNPELAQSLREEFAVDGAEAQRVPSPVEAGEIAQG